jgi:hypothetical protein
VVHGTLNKITMQNLWMLSSISASSISKNRQASPRRFIVHQSQSLICSSAFATRDSGFSLFRKKRNPQSTHLFVGQDH